MAFCGKCGTQIEDGLKFCPACGAEIAAQPSQQYTPPVQEQAVAEAPVFDQADVEKNKFMAILAYIIFLIPLLAVKDSPYVKFHTNQGLVLFIAGVLVGVVSVIPVIGWLVGIIAPIVIGIFCIMGIINAAKGLKKELPLIGKFKILK